MVLVGLTMMADTVGAANTPAEQRLLERIRALEERLNKLEKIEGTTQPPTAAETQAMERLLERLSVLEERLDRLDRTNVIKKKVEYVCPSGEIFTEPPPDGRCPDAARPQVRETVSTESVLRRQSIAEQVEGALQDAEGKKVAIGGSARGILQQVTNGQRGQNDLFPSGAFDLTLLSRPMANTTFFVDIEAIAGPGPDRVLGSLSRLNADVETLGLGGLGIGGPDQRLAIRDAWLGFELFKDRLDLFAGKLDPTNYFDRNAFANDETSQFLDAALVNNPMLKQPPNGPGLVTRWDASRDLGFSLGVLGSREFEGAMFDEPFVVGEKVEHTVKTGKAPEHFDATPDGQLTFVGNMEDSTVSVINVHEGREIQRVTGFFEPHGFSALPDGSKVYVSSLGAHEVAVLGGKSGRMLKRLAVGDVGRVAARDPQRYLSEIKGIVNPTLTRDGAFAYAASSDANVLAIIDTKTDKVVKTLQVGEQPWRAYNSLDGRWMLVPNNGDSTVSVIDTTTQRLSEK